MDEKSGKTDSQYALDLIDAHHEHTEKRLVRAIIVLVLLLAASFAVIICISQRSQQALEACNQKWIDYISEYDFVSYDQNGEGLNIIGDRNGVLFNESETAGEVP